jgi:hypothetical protein
MKRKIVVGTVILALLVIVAYALMSVQVKITSPSGNVLEKGETFDLFINVVGNNNDYSGMQAMLNISNASVINISKLKGGNTGYDLNHEYNGSYSYWGNTSIGDLFHPSQVFYGNYYRTPDIGLFGVIVGNHSFNGSGVFARFKVTALHKGDANINLYDVIIANQSGLPVLLSTEGIHLTVISVPTPTPTPPSTLCERMDFDVDGDVDNADRLSLRRAIAGGSTDSKYDLNNDGNVNNLDLRLYDQTSISC